MDKIKILKLLDISDILDNISTNIDWSTGADGNDGPVDPLAYVILEELYSVLEHRNPISSIKLFKNVYDPLAYEWHVDNSNPTESNVTSTALVYLPTCNGTEIEYKENDNIIKYKPKPYDLIILDSYVEHRAVGKLHGPVLKYTFL